MTIRKLLPLFLTLATWAQAGHSGTSGISGSSTEQPSNPPVVTGMNVLPQNPSAVVGNIVLFTATVTLSNGATPDATALMSWSSTSLVIASVGVLTCSPTNACVIPVTCNSAGAAQIIALFGTLLQASSTLSCTSQPPPPPSLVSIAVTPTNPSVPQGQSQLFTATGTYSDGTTKDITSAVNWASGTPAVATMDGIGPAQQANCVGHGTSVISATDPNTSISGNTTLTCTAVLTSIAVAPTAATILVGGIQQFSATCTYSDGSTKNCQGVTWNSSNTTVATITASGVATGLVAGSSNIDAVLGAITSNVATLTVNNSGPPPPTLTSITVTPANATINVNAQLVYTATCNYSDGSTQNCSLQVAWASTSPSIATISSIGVATGVAAGTTSITATLSSIVGSTGLTVQTPVPTLTSIAVTPTNPTQTDGSSILFTATGTYSDGSQQNVTAQAGWSLGTGGIATILAQSGGTQPVQCNNPGSTTVIATIGAISGNTTLTCKAPVVITGENAYCGTNTDISCFTGNQTDPPAKLPTHGMYTALDGTPSPGSTINVSGQTQLNSALSTVTCGQIISIDHTQTYSNFQLPAKGCDAGHWITFEPDDVGSLPPEHTQITPCYNNQASVANYPTYTCGSPAQLMVNVVCTAAVNGGCVTAASGFDHIRLIGFNIFCNPTGSTVISDCGWFNAGGGANHLILDRSLVHGPPYACTQSGGVITCPSADVTHGVVFSNVAYAAFINGWIYNIGTAGSFSDAVGLDLGGTSCTANSEEVHKGYNSLISAAGEDFFSGGGGCGTGTYTPNDLELRNNHFFKPVIWMQCNGTGNGAGCHGGRPEVKNNGELKNINRALLEGNVCENSWASWQTDQDGYCHLLTPKNQGFALTVTGVSSDATGTILTGAFNANTAGPGCAPGGCQQTIAGTVTKVQSWSAGPPVTVTVSPAVTPNLTNQTVKSCQPGLNPNAVVTNVTMRWGRIMNSRNGIQLAAAVSDCGDLPTALNSISIHDYQMEGVNTYNVNGSPGASGGGQCIQEQNSFAPTRNLHDWNYSHNTCAVFIPQAAFSHAGIDSACDGSDQTGAGTGNMFNRTTNNSIGPSGGITTYKGGTCTTYPGGNSLATNIVKQSGSAWQYTKNVVGIGLWTSQTTGLPLPASNADPGDNPPGNGCGTGQATCHPSGVSAFEALFTQYNSGSGQVGFLGNYALAPGSPYHNQATDGTDIGVSNYTTWNTKLAGVFSPTTYTAASITTGPTLPVGQVNSPYATSLLGTSASPGQNWILTSGSFPPGITTSITCQPGNWALCGTPTVAGTYTFTLELLDMVQQFATQTFTLRVNPASGGGPNWNVAFTDPSNCQIPNYFTIRQSNNEWYLACRDGVVFLKSTNQGASWTNITAGITFGTNGLPWAIQINPNNGDIIATTGGNPVKFWRSSDDGNTWTQMTATGYHNAGAGADSGCALPLSNNQNLVCGGYFGSNGTSAFNSTNNGVTNQLVASYVGGNTSSVLGLATAPDASEWMGTENQGVFKSTNAGATFTNVLGPCPNGCSGNYGDIYFFTFDSSNNAVFSGNGGVWKCTGSGVTYTCTNTYHTNQGRGLLVDSLGSMYYGHLSSSQYPRSVQRSTDGGVTWANWDTGMPNQLEASPFIENSNDGKIYAVVTVLGGSNGQVPQSAQIYSSPK